jgi:two-component system LytT family response regulator
MKAIIVDDEPYSVQTIETLLKNYTPRVEVLGVAFSVKEALPLIKSNLSNLDILFLDIQMPREDGFELLKQLGDINFKLFLQLLMIIMLLRQ